VKNPATKIPFRVELRYAGCTPANSCGNTEWVHLNYHGDLNDKTTKPTGVLFYVKYESQEFSTFIGSAFLKTTKDVTGTEKPTCSLLKGAKVTYDCVVSFNPEKNDITPSRIQFYASAYNSVGVSAPLNRISLFPMMDTKAFAECLENGIDKTLSDLVAVFVGIGIDKAASNATKTLKIENKIYEQGTEAAISLRLKQFASPSESLKNLKDVAAGTSISALNDWLLKNVDIKIAGQVVAGAKISANVIGGIFGAVDIYIAGKNAQYRISDCESNSRN
jgi:hypothetical protein